MLYEITEEEARIICEATHKLLLSIPYMESRYLANRWMAVKAVMDKFYDGEEED